MTVLRYLRPRDWALLAVSVAIIVGQVFLELEIPGYMSSITQIITTGGTVEQVMNEGWGMMFCAVVSLVLSIVVGGMTAYIATSLAKTLREKEFDKVQSFSQSEIDKFSISSLVTRSTNDINQIQMALAIGAVVLIRAPVMAVLAMTKILDKSIEWTWVMVVAIAVMMVIMGGVMWYVIPLFKKIQWMTDDINRVTKENLTGLRVVRAYNAERYQEEKFEAANALLTGTHLNVTRALALMSPGMTAVMCLMSVAIYWIGASLVDVAMGLEKVIIFSDMIVFSSYAMMVVGAFIMLVIVFMILPRARVASARVQEVIDVEPSIVDGSVEDNDNGLEGEILFENVSFKYPGAADYVLRNVSFDVKKGETVAFVGSTGSGKSTLITLVPRFYDVTEGCVKVDGIDVRDYTQEALHRKIGYVPQKAVMFSSTIEKNVNYGDTSEERTIEDVRKAVGIAQGREFVEATEEGYGRQVAEGGTNLSGGQKQRLSIARAVCRKPEIYIFDDSFSALDYKTDRVLRTALKKETAGVTSLIVATRVGTVMDADKIVVLNEGNVVGVGKHRDLLKTCPVYYEIARSQLSEEELA